MNIKPGDFLFGIIEFLAYLVPGMLFLAVEPHVTNLTSSYFVLKSDQLVSLQGLYFVLISYVLGHFIHTVGAWFVNTIYKLLVYDLKKESYADFFQNTELALPKIMPYYYKREQKSQPEDGAIKRLCYWEERKLSSEKPLEIAEAYIKCNGSGQAAELDKYEAKAKLFRSLALICIYLCFYKGNDVRDIIVLICLSLLSFYRFTDQRWKRQVFAY